MRSRQHLQKHSAGFSTCRATDALPVKPSFRAQLGMCQPAFVCARLAVQRSPSLTSLRGAHSLLPASKATCANTLPLARSQQFKTRRHSFSCKRTLTAA